MKRKHPMSMFPWLRMLLPLWIILLFFINLFGNIDRFSVAIALIMCFIYTVIEFLRIWARRLQLHEDELMQIRFDQYMEEFLHKSPEEVQESFDDFMQRLRDEHGSK